MHRSISLDILKIILSIMVVGIHTSFLIEMSDIVSYLMTNSLFRIAVPIFFIINGFFFFDVIQKNNFLLWVKKIGILYSFWMIVYLPFWLNLNISSFTELLRVIHMFIFGYAQLWYLPAILGGAWVLVVIDKKKINMLYIVFILFFAGLLIQYIGNYHIIQNKNIDKLFNMTWIYRNFLFFGFPFFALGYLIRKNNIQNKIKISYLYLVGLLGLLLLIIESYINYSILGKNEGFGILASLIILSPTIFILIYRIKLNITKKTLGLYANGIYFSHFIFYLLYKKWHILDDGTVMTFSVLISSIILSSILINFNKKIKYIL